MRGKLTLLSVMSLLLCLTSFTQTLPFREYTLDDGLPQLQFSRVMQDSRGFIWIPTRNGLSVFDGIKFTTYLRKDGLPSNMIASLVEDPEGCIWVATFNGVARFNGAGFTSYPPPEDLQIRGMSAAGQPVGADKFFLTATAGEETRKIILFDNGKYSDFSEKNPCLKTISPSLLQYDPYDSSLYILDNKGRAFLFRKGTLTSIGEGPFETIVFADNHILFSGNGLKYHYDGQTLIQCQITYTPDTPGLIPDNQERPEILLLTDGHDSTVSKWNKGRITSVFFDHEKDLWLTTENKIYRLLSTAFLEYSAEEGLLANPWAIAADPGGGLWIGSIDGKLQYFDGERFMETDGFSALFSGIPAFFRGSMTHSSGEVWLSTNMGVIIKDGSGFRKLPGLPDHIQVCMIYEDTVDHTVFIGTEKGLYRLDGKKASCYTELSPSDMGVAEGMVRDNSGNYWIAGHYGIVFFDGKIFTPLKNEGGPAEFAWGIIKDNRGNIWTAGADGLFLCDTEERVFVPALPAKDNLPANVIRDIGNNKLLIGRMIDICIIDLEKYYSGDPGYYLILDRSRGFSGNDCQDNGIVRSSDGKWWILTSDKLISFDSDKIVKNNNPPMTYITSVECLVDTLVWKTVHQIDSSLFYQHHSHLTLRRRVHAIRISFTGISTTNPEGVTFNYRLTGLDNNWVVGIQQRTVSFDRLHPGHYVFELTAVNADGVETVEPDTLEITVVPTLLQTWWVRAVFVTLAIMITVFLTFQVRRRVLETRVATARLQAETYKLQLNSVIKQFDPHFTFNAVTSVGSLIMKGEKEKAYNYFIKLSNLLRSVLTDSSVLLKPLSEETEFVTRYCELQKLRFGGRFDFTINIAEGVDLKTLVPKMIIQSFVENAVKHGLENKKGKGMIHVLISRQEKGLEVIVRDNGIGRKAASEMHTRGGGLGLKNINNLVETMNQGNSEKITFTLTDLQENGVSSGTEARIFLPQPYKFDLSEGME